MWADIVHRQKPEGMVHRASDTVIISGHHFCIMYADILNSRTFEYCVSVGCVSHTCSQLFKVLIQFQTKLLLTGTLSHSR